ncbi:Small hydrophobic protein [Gilliamella apicola SCGC AB-598-I20]|nr:Small hydrophobic protein [Gilliamella apicola SCGC AB-598-I20]
MKIFETIFVFILVAIIMAAGNTVGYHIDFISSLKALGVLVIISIVGLLISKLPGLNKFPVILWVSVIAAIVSAPIFPYHEEIVAITDQVTLLAVCTPILAYAGLAIGKDLALFKNISWRIIPVSLAVFSGTFIFAALIAQVTLHWEGVI